LATDVVVRSGIPSSDEKENPGVAVLTDCQKDEKVASASAALTVDLGATSTSQGMI
jgi:hypothetical protein